eukprot:35361-Rhodomonas_salina.4
MGMTQDERPTHTTRDPSTCAEAVGEALHVASTSVGSAPRRPRTAPRSRMMIRWMSTRTWPTGPGPFKSAWVLADNPFALECG